MQFCGRAFYNLLCMNPSSGGEIEVKQWQVEDYREVELGALFIRLMDLGVDLEPEMLEVFFDECDSPEELALALAAEEGTERHGQIYLLIFEVWRRLCREKEALSIFCDELDRLIEEFNDELIVTQELQDAFATLEHILDTNTDSGAEPKGIFVAVCCYLAHDLEKFIYDFIALQIENQEVNYALELLDHFYLYMVHAHRFEFLRIRCIAVQDPDEVPEMIKSLLDQLESENDRGLFFDVLDFSTQYGVEELFLRAFSLLLPTVKSYEEYRELLTMTIHYFESVGRAKEIALLSKMIKQAGKHHAETDVPSNDLEKLHQITLTGVKSI